MSEIQTVTDTARLRAARKDVARMLRQSMHVLSRLPEPPELACLRGKVSSVPQCEMRPERNWMDSLPKLRLRPQPEAFDAALAVVPWLRWIEDPFVKQIVLYRAGRVKWEDIQEADPDRRTIRQLSRLHDAALDLILARLLREQKKKMD